jgi:hypothetical protein
MISARGGVWWLGRKRRAGRFGQDHIVQAALAADRLDGNRRMSPPRPCWYSVTVKSDWAARSKKSVAAARRGSLSSALSCWKKKRHPSWCPRALALRVLLLLLLLRKRRQRFKATHCAEATDFLMPPGPYIPSSKTCAPWTTQPYQM